MCIFDEAQNATLTQLKLFLTRFSDDSKLILTGDPSQTDLHQDVALVDVMEKLQTLKGVGSVQFQRKDIVRHPLIADILERLED
jgi:phosphate starvation-inducible PhoH-like protein